MCLCVRVCVCVADIRDIGRTNTFSCAVVRCLDLKGEIKTSPRALRQCRSWGSEKAQKAGFRAKPHAPGPFCTISQYMVCLS